MQVKAYIGVRELWTTVPCTLMQARTYACIQRQSDLD